VDNKTKNMAFFLNRSSEVKNLTAYLQLAVVKADPYLKTIANIIHGDASDPSLKTVISNADTLVHEVFGLFASSESFTAFAKTIGERTRVLPRPSEYRER